MINLLRPVYNQTKKNTIEGEWHVDNFNGFSVLRCATCGLLVCEPISINVTNEYRQLYDERSVKRGTGNQTSIHLTITETIYQKHEIKSLLKSTVAHHTPMLFYSN